MGDEPDMGKPFSADYERELTPEEVEALSPEEQEDYLLSWFQHYFEDPANETPYESREGGYQYIFGGPYDAQEELDMEFGETVPAEIIGRVVERLERVGTEWAPTDNHPSRSRDDDDSPPDDLDRRIENFEDGANLTPDEVGSAERQAVLEAASKLQEALDKLSKPTIGHNNPPIDLADEESLGQEEINELTDEVEFVKEEAAKPKPNFSGIAKALKAIKAIGKLLFQGVVAQVAKDGVESGVKEWHHLGPLIHGFLEAGMAWLTKLPMH